MAPVSRDSRITVPVNREASEVFLLLAAELPNREKGYFLGHCPTTLDNVEEFAVELVYENGVRDMAFPYSITDGRHVVRRALGVYAVPASGAKLKEVVLHNRKLGARVHLAAMTVNTGKTRRFPALAEEPRLPVAKPQPPDESVKPFARREGDLLQLGNAHYEMTLDAARLLTPVAMQHRRLGTGTARVSASPLLEMKIAGKPVSATQWKLDAVENLPLGFVARYVSTDPSLPLRCAVTMRVDESPEASFELAVHNDGPQPVDAEIRFPVLNGLRLGGRMICNASSRSIAMRWGPTVRPTMPMPASRSRCSSSMCSTSAPGAASGCARRTWRTGSGTTSCRSRATAHACSSSIRA